MGTMPEKESRVWGKVLNRMGLKMHPKNLSKPERYEQWIILSAMSMDFHNLPQRPTYENWYLWLLEHDREWKSKGEI